MVVGVVALVSVAASLAHPTQLQQVTLFGDSVADSIQLDNQAASILKEGVVVNFQVAPCRRLEGVSCPYQGSTPASALQVIQSLGSKLGQNVVMDIGYNDFEDQYAGNVSDALTALKASGVKHVWWVTLRAARHPYVTMNDDIASAVAENSSWVSVIDWNAYSRNHPEWFQSDGVHLLHPGAVAMSTLIHKTLVSAGVTTPPVRIVTSALPVAHRGHPYRAKLATGAGTAPFGWSLLERAPGGNPSPARRRGRRHADGEAGQLHVQRRGPRRRRVPGDAPADTPHRRVVALPDRHVRGLLPDRAPDLVGADRMRPRVARLHPRRELRLLRLVGLAVRLPARRLDGRQSRARGCDLPRAERSPHARDCSRSPSASTSVCSRTSSTRTSSSARSTTLRARAG